MRSTALHVSVWHFASLLGGCGTIPGVGREIAAPAYPDPGSPVQESVRAFLHTFKLSEKDLVPGLTIPFELRSQPGDAPYTCGIARVTGKIGPQGHQVYELVISGDWLIPRFMEIAPEPDTVPLMPSN
jgi:predicted small secreted protein